jgi:hypothetical protein
LLTLVSRPLSLFSPGSSICHLPKPRPFRHPSSIMLPRWRVSNGTRLSRILTPAPGNCNNFSQILSPGSQLLIRHRENQQRIPDVKVNCRTEISLIHGRGTTASSSHSWQRPRARFHVIVSDLRNCGAILKRPL